MSATSANIKITTIIFCLLFILSGTIATLASDPAPTQPALDGYKGWATTGDGTTGGRETNPVTVKTADEFQSAISGSAPRLILVSGTIVLTPGRFYEVGSNKTIRGLGITAVLSNGTIRIQGQANVILQNLVIRDSYDPTPSWDAGDGWNCDNDCVAILASNHVWVDHCDIFNTPITFEEFSGRNKIPGAKYDKYCWYDGLLDITNGSDYVTVSYCNLHGNTKTSLVGSTDGHGVDEGKLRVTYHHNYIHEIGSRGPRVRFGQVHVYNNYYRRISDYALGIGEHAQIVSENNYFENVIQPSRKYDSPGSSGYLADSGSVFKSCSNPIIIQAPAGWTPSSMYSYAAEKVDAGWAAALMPKTGPQP